MLRRVFSGARGPQRDVIVLNAAAGLLAGDKVESLSQGVTLAVEIIDNGKAREKLEQLIQCSNRVGQG
jgi:anthranilate phosphoribosyltransferase